MLKSVLGPVLLVSVYMPTDYGDSECIENYIDTCAYIIALFQDSDAVYLVVAGDCQLGSRFYDCFLKFSSDNKLQLTDLCRLKDVFTYFNDGATASSWIDYIVCSRAIDNLVSSCSVEYQYVSSDHKPLFVSLDRFLPNLGPSVSCVNEPVTGIKFLPDWSKCDEYCLSMYKSELDLVLANINIPSVLFSCTTDNVSDNSTLIDNYYNDVISCINETCSKVVPCRKLKGTASDYIVPGWNDFARDKYDAARSAFLDWVQAGKPRQGTLNSIMRRTRAHFKLALRYCKQHKDTLAPWLQMISKIFGKQSDSAVIVKLQTMPTWWMVVLGLMLLLTDGAPTLNVYITLLQIRVQHCNLMNRYKVMWCTSLIRLTFLFMTLLVLANVRSLVKLWAPIIWLWKP